MPPLAAHLISLLHELAHGPDLGADYGQFSEPEAGLLPTLERLSAVQASVPVATGRPSVAAFVAHLEQLLTFAAGQLDGSIEFPDFSAPWQIGMLDDQGWLALQKHFREAFAHLQSAMQRRELEPEDLNLAQTAVMHAAYHAGALRFHVQNLRAQG